MRHYHAIGLLAEPERDASGHRRYDAKADRLAAGDNLALPSEAVAYLDRLRELGIPEQMPKWIALKREEIEDPEVMAVETVELIDSFFVAAVPVARRLMQLLEERGWSGWTQLEPTTADAVRQER